jgi:tetratricopeptide (TPR) repeat protein
MDARLNRRFLSRAGALALATALAGCASTQSETRPQTNGGTATTTAAAEAEAKGPPPIGTRAMLHFEDANKAFAEMQKSGKYDYDALQRKYEAALAADDRLAEADYDLGVIAERRGNFDAAVSHYQDALKKKPSLKAAAENLAVLAQNKGDVAGAISTWSNIRQQYPDDAVSRAHLAQLYERNGDPDRALEMAQEALVRDPTSTLAVKVQLESYMDKKVWSVARLVWLRATKLAPDDPELPYDLALIDEAEKQPDREKVQLEKALELNPGFAPAHAKLAEIALAHEDWASAETHLRKLLQQEGGNANAHLNLGVALAGLGQYDKAMAEYDLAEKGDPSLAAVYLDRGVILERHKDAPERAVELFKKYLELSGGETAVPNDAPVFVVMKEAKNLIEAKEAMAKAEADAKKAEDEAKKQQALQKQAPPSGNANPNAPANGAAPNGPDATPAKGPGEPNVTPASAKQPAPEAPADAKSAEKPAAKAAAKSADAPTPTDSNEPKDAL